MDGRSIHHLIPRVLFVCVVASAGIIVGAPIAMADPCPPLDLGCVIQTTTTTVGDVLDDTTTTVGDVLEDTTTTVGDVLEGTTTTVGGVLEETTTTVGGVLQGGAGPIMDGVIPAIPPEGPEVLPGAGDPPSGGGPAPPPEQPAPTGGGRPGGGGTHVGSPATGTEAAPRAPVTGPGSDLGTPIGIETGIVGRAHVRFIDDGSAILPFDGATLARTLAFPLLLILLVVGFVLVQNRIDRKDPKLALAPVGADHLSFS